LSLPIFPGCTKPPLDPNNDELCEAINGNSRLDFSDVVTYYNNMAWITQTGLLAYFDYNNNGRIDFNDVLEEWEQKIEAREQKILQAFFEYARDNHLSAFNTPYFFSKQILPDEPIVLKYCIMMCFVESGGMKMCGEKRILKSEVTETYMEFSE
jgi:hypothetical protein